MQFSLEKNPTQRGWKRTFQAGEYWVIHNVMEQTFTPTADLSLLEDGNNVSSLTLPPMQFIVGFQKDLNFDSVMPTLALPNGMFAYKINFIGDYQFDFERDEDNFEFMIFDMSSVSSSNPLPGILQFTGLHIAGYDPSIITS